MILLRHGQSEFNLLFTQTRRDPGIIDPRLTPLGHEQALAARDSLANTQIRRIIASPYTRALQTAAPIAAARGLPVHITALVGERYAFTCDVGAPRSDLQRDWPHLDFSTIDEIWWPRTEEPTHTIAARAHQFRHHIATTPDWAETLVVSHWGFILATTGIKVTNGQILHCNPADPPPANITWHH